MRRKQVTEVDPTEKFRTNSIRYAVDDLRAIIGSIDMNAERPLAKRQAISPKQPFDSASRGREARRGTAAALEAHMQHTHDACADEGAVQRIAQFGCLYTSAESMSNVRMNGVVLTPRSTGRYFNVAR
jgi:hypothetical protein